MVLETHTTTSDEQSASTVTPVATAAEAVDHKHNGTEANGEEEPQTVTLEAEHAASPQKQAQEPSPAQDNPTAQNGITPELPKFLYTAMAQVAQEQGFGEGKYALEFDVGSNKGDGFVGQMFKAILTEGDRREVYLCKIPPLNEARRQQFPVLLIFARETLAYSKLHPLMFAYQREKGVREEDGFFNVPKAYHTYCNVEADESVIVMEDLRLQDYRMWDKMKPVNYEHARLMMEQLGRLHAVSLAMKRDQPAVFEQFKVPDPMSEMMPEGSPFDAMMRKVIQDAIGTLEPTDTKELAKMQLLLQNFRKTLERCSNGALAEPHTVLGHGDCWVNNMMYHYKNGVPERIILLDWQLTRYVTPVLDLTYFIFCCTDGEFRKRHYDEMMSIYYNSLEALLEKLGHVPQSVFPRTAFMRQLRTFGRFGVLMAVFLVPMLCTRNEDLVDMDEAAEKFRDTKEMDMSMFSKNDNNRSAYTTRMRAVIKDSVRYGYL
ncbi:uncharacterized protein LOC128275189 [Anopheles cruzii]|uniref:uncharacterized protein LOC128275189 n=1 Tax=Anopheles cruzii TaxID=68878 RepID=UPI0022EC673C|nr:uncharacterized protein LOC128275189 [Anopheles cruzii]